MSNKLTLSKQGKRIFDMAKKKAQRNNIEIKSNNGWGVVFEDDRTITTDEDNCCCIMGACLANKKVPESLKYFSHIDVMVRLYGETREYYEGIAEGFDNYRIDKAKADKYPDYEVGFRDGRIITTRLGNP